MKRLSAIVTFVVVVSALALVTNWSAGLPTVHLTMDGECVRVIADDGTKQDFSVVDLNHDRYHPVVVASDADVKLMSGR